LIKKDNKNVLLPSFLRFVKGVVDCEDIPLNISRENFQDSALIAKLRAFLTKRVIKLLKDEA
jgi:HSP90 family molecular chaperone